MLIFMSLAQHSCTLEHTFLLNLLKLQWKPRKLHTVHATNLHVKAKVCIYMCAHTRTHARTHARTHTYVALHGEFYQVKYNVKVDLGDIIEAHCYVEYNVGLVNF